MYKIRERKKYKYMIFLLQMLCTIYIIDRRAGNCGEIELGRPANQAAARLGSTHHHHHRHYHHQQYYDHHCVFGIWEQVFFRHMFGIWVSMIVSMGLFRGIKGCAFNIIGTQHVFGIWACIWFCWHTAPGIVFLAGRHVCGITEIVLVLGIGHEVKQA